MMYKQDFQLSSGSAIISSSLSVVALIVIIIFSSLLELSELIDWVDVAASYKTNVNTARKVFTSFAQLLESSSIALWCISRLICYQRSKVVALCPHRTVRPPLPMPHRQGLFRSPPHPVARNSDQHNRPISSYTKFTVIRCFWCVLMCLDRWSDRINFFPHSEHWKRFSPVCVRLQTSYFHMKNTTNQAYNSLPKGKLIEIDHCH